MSKLLAAALATLALATTAYAATKPLAAREAAFEARLALVAQRNGPQSPPVVRALSDFGVELWQLDEPAAQQASLGYLRRAADTAATAYGDTNPEYATELHSYAVAVRNLQVAEKYPDAIAAMRKALAVRRAALGEANAGTVNAMGTLASMLSAPVHVAQSPNACAEAVPMADESMNLTARHRAAFGEEVLFMYGDAAETYGHCGEVGKTFAAAEAASADSALNPALARMAYTRAEQALEAAGLTDQAKALNRLYPGIETYTGS